MDPVITNQQATSFVHKELDWFKHHLISLALVAALVWGTVYGIESIIAKHDHENFLEKQAISQQYDKQNQITQQQNKATVDALTQQNQVLQQQVASILQQNVTLMANLQKQREEIKTLPPPALAAKWGDVAHEPAPVITANGDFLAPLPLAQKSVDALISVPVLQQDANNLQVALDKETTLANNNQSKYESELKAHTSDTATCTADKNTLNAQISEIKSEARKSKSKWAIIGGVIGFIARSFVHIG